MARGAHVATRPLTQRMQVSRWPLPPTPIRQFHCQFHFCQLLSAFAANAPAHLLLLSILNRPKMVRFANTGGDLAAKTAARGKHFILFDAPGDKGVV